MTRMSLIIVTALLALVLVGCGGSGSAEAEQTDDGEAAEDTIGGYVTVDPEGGEIYIPSAIAQREAVENYLQDVRPTIAYTARDFSQFVNPNVELQDQTLTLSVEVESIEQADQALEQGLDALQLVEVPEGLEPIHESLVEAYEQALPAYDNILEAFDSGDVDQLAEALREGLPEIARFNTEARAILQELERVETDNPDDHIESRGVQYSS